MDNYRVDRRKSQKFRLDRLLSQAAGLTRREAQRTIRGGEVRINGAGARDPAVAVTAADRIDWLDRTLDWPAPLYLMVNKPLGVVCATRDRQHRTILDLIEGPDRRDLHIAGRLDIDTTGLVLVTTDGEWSHLVTAPKNKVPRVYLATVASALGAEAVARLEKGIQLRGESTRCRPAQVEMLNASCVRISVSEGRYHQVRRMLAAVGSHVLALHRERIGSVRLDPTLAEGGWRPLSTAEVQAMIADRPGHPA